MMRLFAAIDALGSIRFIGEVTRGAACGCFCPECASPLVAKHGDEREWHFAHEAGQERPECEAGAMNMLRRLAVEHLRVQPCLDLPRYTERVTVHSERRQLFEDVEWNAQFIGSLEWLPLGPKSAPVAIGRLDNGTEAQLLVEIGDEKPRYQPEASDARGAILFWCQVPVLSDLRNRPCAEQHIKRRGQLLWKHPSDARGLIDTARARLQAQAETDKDEALLGRQRHGENAGRRWALMGNRLRNQSSPGGVALASAQVERGTSEVVTGQSATGFCEPLFDWAPERKANTAFMFYQMTDGAAWVTCTS